MLWQKVCALPKIAKSTNKYNENLVRHRAQLFGKSFLPMTERDTISTLYNVCGGDLHYFSESLSSQKLLENISECKFGPCFLSHFHP